MANDKPQPFNEKKEHLIVSVAPEWGSAEDIYRAIFAGSEA
jgi:hypothetical protein